MADQNMNNNEINDTEMTDPRSSELENQVQAQEATMEEPTAVAAATATMMNHNGSVENENDSDYSSLPLVLSSTYRPRVTRMPPSFATATATAAAAASATATAAASASLASSSSLFGTTQTSTVPSLPASITSSSSSSSLPPTTSFTAAATASTVTTDFTGEKKSATQKRKEIQSIMANPNLTDLEKRLMIQRVMDGRTVMDDSKRKSDNDDDESESKLPANNMNNTNPNFIMNMNGLTMLSKPGPADRNIQNSTNNNNNNNIELDLTNVPPCTHYERNCYIIAPDCCYPKVFGCRLCHDEYYMNIASSKRAVIPTSSSTVTAQGRENNNHHQPHQLNRFAIQEIICKVCHTRQPSKTNKCINIKCNVQFGDYHCQICNLWMSGNIEKKKPFHCDKCGFCRVGGQENFKHCDKCCMCISVKIYDSHNCMKDKYKNDCPVCREDVSLLFFKCCAFKLFI